MSFNTIANTLQPITYDTITVGNPFILGPTIHHLVNKYNWMKLCTL